MNGVKSLDKRSIALRKTILDMVAVSRRGHIGSAFSSLEIIRVLYDEFLSIDPKKPQWKDRDRFLLSKGHGCLALYAVLADKGFFPKKTLATFCQFDSPLGGHPQYGKVPGVEASTGSLGHGLSIGLGFALYAHRVKNDWKTVVLISDGECDEGSTWEAVLCAGKYRLPNLLILVDYNKMQSYASTSHVQNLEPFAQKFQAYGFSVAEADGHNMAALRKTIDTAWKDRKNAHVIICHTVKGKGVPFIESNPAWHHKSKITDEEMERLYRELREKLK